MRIVGFLHVAFCDTKLPNERSAPPQKSEDNKKQKLWGVTLSKSSFCKNFTHNFRHLYLNQKVHLGHGSWYHRVEQLLGCRMHLLNLV